MRSDLCPALLLLLVGLLLPRPAQAQAQAQDDPMAEYRQRFKAGLARYQEGAVADAIRLWEPIYGELGPERGFRLSWNLARAYDALGETTRAVERYRSFLAVVARKQDSGEALDELVVREQQEARERLEVIDRTKARIVFLAPSRPVAVKVDESDARLAGFTAYVAGGTHTVVFEPGTPRASSRTVAVEAGQVIEIASPSDVPTATDVPVIAPPPIAPTSTRREAVHPFPVSVVWISAGATAASVLLPVFTWRSASSFQDEQRLSPSSDPSAQAANAQIQSEYDAKKAAFYGTLAVPLTLAAVTGGLATWYVVGSRAGTSAPSLARSSDRSPLVDVRPNAAATPDGFVAGASGRF